MATVNEKMTAIADAIRDKTGGTEPLNLDQMAEGVPVVFEAGKKTQHYEYWDKALYGGQKQSFNYAFSGVWLTDEIFNPPEKMTLKAKGFNSAFQYAENLTRIDITLDLSEMASSGKAIYGCTNLTRIKKIISSASSKWETTVFQAATKLVDVEFEGVIGASINFSSSPLSVKSMKSIIGCLAPNPTTACTISFKSTCWTKLEADSTAPDGGTWQNYVMNKGWDI